MIACGEERESVLHWDLVIAAAIAVPVVPGQWDQ